jgi:hypothetical protein
MIRRYVSVCLAALALPFFVGCAADTDESSLETSAESTEALTGANGSTYRIASFDGVSLLGFNNQGKTFSASYAGTTSFKLAAVDRYTPVDPCRTAAAAYNAYFGTNDTVGFNASLSTLAANSCKARVLISGVTIRSFQPVP